MIVPNNIREQYIKEETKEIENKLSGFSVSGVEVAEAAYHHAKERWEAEGYVDPPSSFSSISKRENDVLKRILP